MAVPIYLVDVFTFKIMTLPPKTQAQRLADVSLELLKRWPNWIGEASRQSFAIRAEYEKKTDDILTNPDKLCEK